MIANAKVKVFLLDGEKKQQLNTVWGKQVKKEGPITAADLKKLIVKDLFDTALYRKKKEEVWGDNAHLPLNDEVEVHTLPNLTYIVYLTKK